MPAITAICHGGRVNVDVPGDWPEGAYVRIELLKDSEIGMREEDWPTTPEGIAYLIKKMDELEPLEMSEEEEARWKQAREEQKAYQKSIFFQHSEKLRLMFDDK